uniref:Uncharacterized protein n=1 Tax=Glossina palpalis gambiensis TaxID=67801 RepID=A0A1B0BKQ6_9MUSC
MWQFTRTPINEDIEEHLSIATRTQTMKTENISPGILINNIRYLWNLGGCRTWEVVELERLWNSEGCRAREIIELGRKHLCVLSMAILNQPDSSAAMSHYGAILDIKNASRDSRFQLGILRYAYRMEALEAFRFASKSDADQLIATVGKAKALYFLSLNHLEKAELYFAEATRFTIYSPNDRCHRSRSLSDVL